MKMIQWVVLLSLLVHGCTAVNTSCECYPSAEYRDVGMECSGEAVTEVPRLLPSGLQVLLLTRTAISSLDNTSFHERDLPELTTLRVTEGVLTRVGAHAFRPLSSLTYLNLSHNRLDFLDDLSFSSNIYLRSVNLANNPTLHHLPQLASSSVEKLYVDDCNIERIDVGTLERMTALKELSLLGNPQLHCPTEIEKFKRGRPYLSVTCHDSAGGDLSAVSPQDRTSEKSFNDSTTNNIYESSVTEFDSTLKNTVNSIDGENHISEKSFTEFDSTTKNKKTDTTDEGRISETARNETNPATNNNKNDTAASSDVITVICVLSGMAIVAGISIATIYRKRYQKVPQRDVELTT